MLTITEKSFREEYASLAAIVRTTLRTEGQREFSVDLPVSGYHYPELCASRHAGEWIVSLLFSTVIGGEQFAENKIELCYLHHSATVPRYTSPISRLRSTTLRRAHVSARAGLRSLGPVSPGSLPTSAWSRSSAKWPCGTCVSPRGAGARHGFSLPTGAPNVRSTR